MKNIVTNTFVTLVLSAPFFMFANMIGGAMLADYDGDFDEEVLRAGLIKYLGLVVIAILLYIGGHLADAGIKEALDIDLHISDIILVGFATYGSTYALQAIDKFNKLAKVQTNTDFEEE